MERFVRFLGCSRSAPLLLVVAALFQSVVVHAQPTLGVAASLPASIVPGRPFTLTVFITLPDPGVIPGGVNLLRLTPNGEAVVLGQLHDDGKNGDDLAADTVYTLQVPVNEPAVGQIMLRVSAAFQGQLRRVMSPVLTIPITLDTSLPPDPGPAGLITLQGIDSDNDGVRDDVQRYIALTYPASVKTRMALTDIARSMQLVVLGSTDSQQSVTNIIALGHAMECSIAIHGTSAKQLMSLLRAQLLNTEARTQAYLQANTQFSGHTYALAPDMSQRKLLCSFNPDLLPN